MTSPEDRETLELEQQDLTEPTGTPYRYAESRQSALDALDMALDELNRAVPGSTRPTLRNAVDLATVAALAHLVAIAPAPELVHDDLADHLTAMLDGLLSSQFDRSDEVYSKQVWYRVQGYRAALVDGIQCGSDAVTSGCVRYPAHSGEHSPYPLPGDPHYAGGPTQTTPPDRVVIPETEPPVGTRVRTGDGTVFERIHRHGASWFEVMDNGTVSGLNPRSWAALWHAPGRLEVIPPDRPSMPGRDRPLTDAEVCDIAVASGWIDDTPEARAAYLTGDEPTAGEITGATIVRQNGAHHVVDDIEPDGDNAELSALWDHVALLRNPGPAPLVRVFGLDDLSLVNARHLAAELLSAAARADAGKTRVDAKKAAVELMEEVTDGEDRPLTREDFGRMVDKLIDTEHEKDS